MAKTNLTPSAAVFQNSTTLIVPMTIIENYITTDVICVRYVAQDGAIMYTASVDQSIASAYDWPTMTFIADKAGKYRCITLRHPKDMHQEAGEGLSAFFGRCVAARWVI